MVGLDGALMGPEEPSFEKTCDAMNTGQGYVGRIAGFGDDMWLVPVVLANSRRIGRQTVGDDDGAWHDTVKQKQAKCGRLSVGNDTQAASPEALGAKQLNGYRNQCFALRTSSPLPRANTGNERAGPFQVPEVGGPIPLREALRADAQPAQPVPLVSIRPRQVGHQLGTVALERRGEPALPRLDDEPQRRLRSERAGRVDRGLHILLRDAAAPARSRDLAQVNAVLAGELSLLAMLVTLTPGTLSLDLTIQAANRRFQEDFDLAIEAFCHKVYKGRNNACPDCPVVKGPWLRA